MKDVKVISKTIPANPRSDNYQIGSTVMRAGGGGIVSVDLSGKLDKSVWTANFEELTDPNGLEYLYLSKPIVMAAGATMYAGKDILIPSIFDGLPLDQTSIGWRDGKLSVLGNIGGGISSAPVTGTGNAITSASLSDDGRVLSLVKGATFLTEHQSLADYAKKTDIPSLTGYATESWVNNKGYLIATSQDKSNWNTAFGWGNHAGAGYAKTSDLANYVTLATEQEITGAKTFTADTTAFKGITIGGVSVKKSEDGVLILDGNLLVTGGVTMHALGSRKAATIMDGVLVDGTTIVKENGKLVVVGGGGGLDTARMWAELGSAGSEQIAISHLTTALGGYVKKAGDNMAGELSFGSTNRRVKIGVGYVTQQILETNSGWAQSYAFTKLDNTTFAEFGVLGENQSFTYAYVGSAYNTPWQTWNASGTNINVPLTLSGNTVWHTGNLPKNGLWGGSNWVNHSNINASYTAQSFIESHLVSLYAGVSARGAWDYSGNGYIATDFGNIHLAGTAYTAWGANYNRSLLFITPGSSSGVSSPLLNEMLFYSSNSGDGSYPKGWTRVLTNRNYNAYSPSLAGAGANGTWSINITGNAAYASNATRLHASESPYNYGGSSPYYMYMNYNSAVNRWRLKVYPETPKEVEVAYADLAGASLNATSLSNNNTMSYGWSGLQYFNQNMAAGNGVAINDAPTPAWWHIMRFNHANGTGYYTDLAVPFNDPSLYYKRITGGSLAQGWTRILDANNWTEYTNITNGGGDVAAATGWFRIGVFRSSDASGGACRLYLTRNYNHANNEAYIFDICQTYSDNFSITQVSGTTNQRLIDKIRINITNGVAGYATFIDIHVGTYSTSNSINWRIEGSASAYSTFQTATESGSFVVFDTDTGIKTNGFLVNIVGDGEITTLATGTYKTDPYGLLGRVYNNGNYSLEAKRFSRGEYFNLLLNPNGGNVGIGTTSPAYKLHVNGSARSATMMSTNFELPHEGTGTIIGSYNGLFSGNGDNASYSTHNLIIRSWYGIGIRGNDNVCRLVINARNGDISTQGNVASIGSITAGNAGIASGGRITSNSDILSNGWVRTVGATGWYSESYGGGIYMVDATWVRTYNGKQFYCDSGSESAIHTAGGVHAAGRVYAGGYIKAEGGYSVRYDAGSWLSMATRGNCIVADQQNSPASAHSLFRTQWNNGYVMSYGGLGDMMGFFAYSAYNIANGINSRSFATYWNSDGTLVHEGNLLLSGGATMNGSDITKKDIINHILLPLDKIANAPLIRYRWKDNRNTCTNIGGSAQYTNSLLPECAYKVGDTWSMDYATTAYAFAVSTAVHFADYIKKQATKEDARDIEIRDLKQRIEILERRTA